MNFKILLVAFYYLLALTPISFCFSSLTFSTNSAYAQDKEEEESEGEDEEDEEMLEDSKATSGQAINGEPAPVPPTPTSAPIETPPPPSDVKPIIENSNPPLTPPAPPSPKTPTKSKTKAKKKHETKKVEKTKTKKKHETKKVEKTKAKKKHETKKVEKAKTKKKHEINKNANKPNGMRTISSVCNLREKPNSSSKKLATKEPGTKLWVDPHNKGWGKVYMKAKPAYISMECLK